jgi:hypothetical protein
LDAGAGRVTVLSDDAAATATRFGVRAVARRRGYRRRLAGETMALAACDAFLLGGGGLIKDYVSGSGNAPVWVRPVQRAAEVAQAGGDGAGLGSRR